MSNKGLKLEKENFTVEVKYSDEAVVKKLVKFTVTKGNEIVLSADEIISMLVNQVNSEVLSAAFVETDRVNVVEVMRQIQCILDKDYKKGDVININYSHPYPVEFAIIEEAFKIAQIYKDAKVTELTSEYLEDVRKRISPKAIDFTKKFYQSFNSVDIKNKKMEETKPAETITESEAAQAETVTVPREEVVKELGEEAVADIEKTAIPVEVVPDEEVA